MPASSKSSKLNWKNGQRIWIAETDQEDVRKYWKGLIDRYATAKDMKEQEGLTAEHVKVYYLVQDGLKEKWEGWFHQDSNVCIGQGQGRGEGRCSRRHEEGDQGQGGGGVPDARCLGASTPANRY